ncbi:hypothetical protein TNCV_4043781 [Trichonephila clavipes]|nr:hypothetical protein TNCV_4043781 [Trichonephila clavipes]
MTSELSLPSPNHTNGRTSNLDRFNVHRVHLHGHAFSVTRTLQPRARDHILLAIAVPPTCRRADGHPSRLKVLPLVLDGNSERGEVLRCHPHHLTKAPNYEIHRH